MSMPASDHPIVSQNDWIAARKELLAKEKELTRLRDELGKQRRALPWVKVEKDYRFDGPQGEESLSELFDGRSQLIVYHFMMGPTWDEGCKSCSFVTDHYQPALVHLAARDVTLVSVSRAPLAKIDAFKRRMGWQHKWLSSAKSDFNFDFHVSFRPEEIAAQSAYYNYQKSAFPVEEGPGLSVFYKDPRGTVFHTYSCYARGLDPLIGTYHFLDLVPKGRDEEGETYPMAWVRHHDRY